MTKQYTVTMTFECDSDYRAISFIACIKQPSRIFGISPDVKIKAKELPGVYDHNTLEKVG